jgi:hypothetical protein
MDSGSDHGHDAAIADLLRRGAFDDAETRIAAALAEVPGPIADACLATSAESVTIPTWEGLDAELTRLAERHVVTAVELDLSNYNDQDGAREWWDKEPCIEGTVYTDDPYPFSRSTTEEILTAGSTYSAPWTGRFADGIEWYVETSGLRRLNGELLRDEERAAAARLGQWWRALRFRQAVARHVDDHGLALVVPVLVGSHDAGPWLVTVQRVPRESAHAATSRRINDERRERNLAAYREVTEEAVDRLWEYRTTVKGFGFRDLVRLRPYIENADAHVRTLCRASGQPLPSRSITRMKDAELEAIVEGWRADRRARES